MRNKSHLPSEIQLNQLHLIHLPISTAKLNDLRKLHDVLNCPERKEFYDIVLIYQEMLQIKEEDNSSSSEDAKFLITVLIFLALVPFFIIKFHLFHILFNVCIII